MAKHLPEPSELDALEIRIRALEQQRKALLAEQISSEQAGIVPTRPEPGETPQSRVQRFLNGFRAAGLIGQNRGERLFEIIHDQPAIGSAISELERKRLLLHGERDQAEAEARAPQWRALCRELILCAERMKHLEESARAIPVNVRMRLPLSHHLGTRSIVGANWASDPVSRLRHEALELGIISKRDIQEWAS